jgi:TctA family transporter
MILGGLLLVAGVAAIATADGKPFDRWDRLDPSFFPVVVGGLVLALGGVLPARGGAGVSAPWSLRALTITALGAVVTLIVLAVGGNQSSPLPHLLLLFGPAEYAAAIILILTIGVTFARMSRPRACGMALLGLLLATVGRDIETGDLRLNLGLEALNDGFELSFLDLAVTADAAMSLLAPSSYAASYTQILAGWTNQQIPAAAQAADRRNSDHCGSSLPFQL